MNSWLKEIDHAKTEAEVVSTARDYVALWSPPELSEFPDDCRVIRIENQADIARWREKLTAGIAKARARAANAERLDELVKFVDRAHQRIGEIKGL